jgi:TonB family protein
MHVAALILLAAVPFESAPPVARGPLRAVALVAPVGLARLTAPKPRRLPKNRVRSQELAQTVPSVQTPHVFREPAPHALLRVPVSTVEIPPAAVDLPLNPPPAAAAHLPVLPAPPLKTDNLASAARATAAPAAGRIENAGFGEAAITSVATPQPARIATGAFGNAGTEKITTPAPVRPSSAGFGDATVAAVRATGVSAAPSAVETPMEILEKLRPAYTEDARRLRLEGEVLAEVLFPRSGPPRVLRILRGLGHGLDENAVAAAQSIRFRPATRGGQPVDSTAVVHIVFQITF